MLRDQRIVVKNMPEVNFQRYTIHSYILFVSPRLFPALMIQFVLDTGVLV